MHLLLSNRLRLADSLLREEGWTYSDDDLRLFICIFICAVAIGAVLHFAGKR